MYERQEAVMKKFLIRKTSFLLAALMIGSAALTGCGSGSSGSSKTVASSSAASTAKVADLGGKTVKIAVWYEPEKPTLGKSDSEDAWYYSLQQAEKKFNCKVQWIINPQETHFTKFVQASLSGEVYADILMCHSWNWVSLIKQKLICSTDQYIDSASDKSHWEKQLYTYNGKCWAIQPATANLTPTQIFFYNTKIIKELGLESPQSLALNGKWTWDKFRQYCKAATNAKLGRYGVACFQLPEMLMSTNGFQTVAFNKKDGKYYNGYTYSETKDAGMNILELIQTMSQVDNSVDGSWPDGQDALDSGENDFLDGKVLFVYGRNAASMKKEGMTDFAPVTAPLGPNGQYVTEYLQAFAFWSLPTNSSFSADDRAAFWMDAKRTWDKSKGNAYYDDTSSAAVSELADSYLNKSDAEFLLKMGQKMVRLPDLAGSMSVGTVIADDMYGKVIRGESTPAAVVAATDNVLQAKIDSTFNSSK